MDFSSPQGYNVFFSSAHRKRGTGGFAHLCAKDCWNALEGAERPRSRKQELRQQRTPSPEGGLRPDAR